MTKAFRILAIAWFLFMLCAPSCIDEQESALQKETLLNEEQARIREAFEADYLDEVSLFAMETMAKQKLADLADYFQILADTSLKEPFRMKAGEMIGACFLSETISVTISPPDSGGGGGYEIGRLVLKGLNNEFRILPFLFDSIRFQEPFRRIGNDLYSGNIAFIQVFHEIPEPELIQGSINRIADIFIVKDNKVFGDDTLHIWSARLGEIH